MARGKHDKPINRKRRFAIILSSALALAVAAASITYAWLVLSTSSENKLLISDINTDCIVCFASSSAEDNTIDFQQFQTQVAATGSVFRTDSLIAVNLTNPNASNYLGNLRIVSKCSSGSPAYVRVKVIEEWVRNDEYIASDLVDFTTGAGTGTLTCSDGEVVVVPSYNTDITQGTWFDNRHEDFAYYYTAPVYPAEINSNNYNDIYMFAVNGVTNANMEKLGNLGNELELNILVQVEMVQPNRYREFWNIDTLPWEQ